MGFKLGSDEELEDLEVDLPQAVFVCFYSIAWRQGYRAPKKVVAARVPKSDPQVLGSSGSASSSAPPHQGHMPSNNKQGNVSDAIAPGSYPQVIGMSGSSSSSP